MQHEMMNTSRREFLKGGVAFGGLVAASALRVFADEANGRRLRIGILSDTHLDGGAVAAQRGEGSEHIDTGTPSKARQN